MTLRPRSPSPRGRRAATLTLSVTAVLGLLTAVSLTRPSYEIADGSAPCPRRTLASALRGLSSDSRSAEYTCTAAAQSRLLMAGIAGLLVTAVAFAVFRRRQHRGVG